MQRWQRTLLMVVVGTAIGLFLGWQEVQQRGVDTTPAAPMLATGGITLGGDFTLTNHLGKTVNAKSWPNKTLLIYFGFTFCPDVCPTGLQKMFAAIGELPKAQQAKLQPILITLDPARDNVETLKNYVGLFDERLVGLTGTQAQIDAVVKAYRVYAQKMPPNKDGDYMINHSAYLYVVHPNGEVAGVVNTHDPQANINQQLDQLL